MYTTTTLRRSLYALLLAPLLFTACSKGSDNTTPTPVVPANEFIINGIHDVNFSTVGGNVLAIAVAQTSGTQQPVTLSVTGLPSGISADIQPASGTPAFSSIITFSLTGTIAAGTYPVHVTGTSASYTKTYDLNIVVPAINGFTLDGMLYKSTSLNHSVTSTGGSSSVSSIQIHSADNGGGSVLASLFKALPTADGSYNYPVGGTSADAMYFYVSIGSAYYSLSNPSDSTKMATVIISGGKYSLRVPEVSVSYGSVTKKLIVNANE